MGKIEIDKEESERKHQIENRIWGEMMDLLSIARQLISQVENAELDRMNFVNVNGKEWPLASFFIDGKYSFAQKHYKGLQRISKNNYFTGPTVNIPPAKFPERELCGPDIAFDYVEYHASNRIHFDFLGGWTLVLLTAVAIFFAGVLIANHMNKPETPKTSYFMERPERPERPERFYID